MSFVSLNWSPSIISKNESHFRDKPDHTSVLGELASRLAPERSLRLQFAVLTKSKSPVVEVHEVTVDPSRVDRTKRVFERTWSAIESGLVYPAPSVMNCSGCPFQQPCREWTGLPMVGEGKEVTS